LSNLEDAPGFFIDEAGDALDPSATSQPPNCWLGDALDIVTKDFPVTLGASLAKTFATLASARHVVVLFVLDERSGCTLVRLCSEGRRMGADGCLHDECCDVFEQVPTLTRPHTALFCLDRAALVNRPKRPLCPLNCNRQQQQQHKLEHNGLFCHICLFFTAGTTCLDVVRERQPERRQ